MAHQPQQLEPPIVEPEEGPDAHVVALGLDRAGHAVEPPEIIALPRARGVHPAIRVVVVGLLENLVGGDSGGLDGHIAVVVQRRGVEVTRRISPRPAVAV